MSNTIWLGFLNATDDELAPIMEFAESCDHKEISGLPVVAVEVREDNKEAIEAIINKHPSIVRKVIRGNPNIEQLKIYEMG